MPTRFKFGLRLASLMACLRLLEGDEVLRGIWAGAGVVCDEFRCRRRIRGVRSPAGALLTRLRGASRLLWQPSTTAPPEWACGAASV